MKRTNGRALVLGCLIILSIAAMTFITSRQGVKAKQPNSNQPPERFVPGRVLVKFQDHVLPAHARNIIAALGARDADEIPGIGVHILDLPDQANEKAFVAAFQSQPDVQFAELDQIVEPADVVPNDPYYPNAWHLAKNFGAHGLVDFDRDELNNHCDHRYGVRPNPS